MKTLSEIIDLVEEINEDAHSRSFDSWVAADELMESDDEADWETAEEMREEASLEQAEYFRESYFDLEQEDQEDIKHWLEHDSDFKEQFAVYFGEDAFADEFGSY